MSSDVQSKVLGDVKIGKSDGPTSVFILNKNTKLTLKQKIQK